MLKLKKVLIKSLSFLFENNIQLSFFLDSIPIRKKPLDREKAAEFIKHVKFNRIEEAEEILLSDKTYCFEFDYFKQTAYHWAAKRGFLKMLLMLLKYYKYVNCFDIKGRTPMFLAAENGFKDIVELLCNEGTNPFHRDEDDRTASEAANSKEHTKIRDLIDIYTTVLA